MSLSKCPNKVRALAHQYCVWVAKNPGISKEVELGVKLSSYLLVHIVDRNGSSDVIHQMFYCISDLLAFINDLAIAKAYPNSKLPYGNNLKTWLTALEYVEVCFELGAQKTWGRTGKWAMITLIQVFKCISRIILLRRNEGLLSYPPIAPLNRENVGSDILIGTQDNKVFQLGSGVVIRRLGLTPAFNQAASQRPGEDFKQLQKVTAEYQFKGYVLISEVLYALKPLIHLGAMGLTGRNSWTQWMTGLAVECTSLHLQWNEYISGKFTHSQDWQYVSRISALLLYLLRSPFYDNHVKYILLGILKFLRRIFPFLKFIIEPAIEFMPTWHDTYFYLWSH